MKKQPINQPLYLGELERLQFDQAEQEIHKVIEADLVPSSSELQKYNQMIPNGAERILTIIEEEKKHRRKIEKSKQDVRNVTKILSMIFGFVLTLLLFISTMRFGVSRFEFILLWSVTLVILGLIFAPYIKESMGNRSAHRDY